MPPGVSMVSSMAIEQLLELLRANPSETGVVIARGRPLKRTFTALRSVRHFDNLGVPKLAT